MLLHVEGPGVEGEEPIAEAREGKLGPREHPREEMADWERGHLDRDLGDDERLGAVSKELVEEGHERAGEQPNEPHPEGPHGEGGVIGGGHGEADLLDRGHLLLRRRRRPTVGLLLHVQRRSPRGHRHRDQHCASEVAGRGGGVCSGASSRPSSQFPELYAVSTHGSEEQGGRSGGGGRLPRSSKIPYYLCLLKEKSIGRGVQRSFIPGVSV